MTINTDPVKTRTHVTEAGTVTAHTLGDAEVSIAMPAPDKVMRIPALLAPLVRAWVGVNVNEAVVTVAFTGERSVIARPLTNETLTNEPAAVVSRTEGVETDTSNEVPAAMLANPA